MCTCEREHRRCVFMYFSAFNPKKLGPTMMIARRLFSIPLQRSSDWPDFTLWILTRLYPSQLIDWSARWSTNWPSCKLSFFVVLHCVGQPDWPAQLHCWQCTFSCNIVDNIRKKYSQQYCRWHTFYQDCVFEEYMCIFSLYVMIYDSVYIIRYPCIFSLRVGCRWSWKSLIDTSRLD